MKDVGKSSPAGAAGLAAAIDGPPVRVARPSLVSVLAEAGVASEERLRLAVAEGMRNGERLGELVVRLGWIDQQGLARLLARQWGLPFLEDAAVEFDPAVRSLTAFQPVRELGGLLIGSDAEAALVVVSEPETRRLNELRAAVGENVSFAVVAATTLQRLEEQVVGSEQSEAPLDEKLVAPCQSSTDVIGKEMVTLVEELDQELDAATSDLTTGLRERIKQLYRPELIHLQEQRAAERAARAELEQQLAACRHQLAAVRATLSDLLDELDSDTDSGNRRE